MGKLSLSKIIATGLISAYPVISEGRGPGNDLQPENDKLYRKHGYPSEYDFRKQVQEDMLNRYFPLTVVEVRDADTRDLVEGVTVTLTAKSPQSSPQTLEREVNKYIEQQELSLLKEWPIGAGGLTVGVEDSKVELSYPITKWINSRGETDDPIKVEYVRDYFSSSDQTFQVRLFPGARHSLATEKDYLAGRTLVYNQSEYIVDIDTGEVYEEEGPTVVEERNKPTGEYVAILSEDNEVITGGKDCKVIIWLPQAFKSQKTPRVERITACPWKSAEKVKPKSNPDKIKEPSGCGPNG